MQMKHATGKTLISDGTLISDLAAVKSVTHKSAFGLTYVHPQYKTLVLTCLIPGGGRQFSANAIKLATGMIVNWI